MSRLADTLVEDRRPASAWNLANGLTLLRFLLVPVFAIALFQEGGHHTGWRVVALTVFVVASLTDRLDGELARKRGLVTDVGKIADPLADKALTGTALVALSLLGELAWWVTAIVLVREVGVTLIRLWVIRHGVIAASRGGKLKTVLQAVAISMYVASLPGWLAAGSTVVMGLAVVVTVVTGLDYVARGLRLRRGSGRDTGGHRGGEASGRPRAPGGGARGNGPA
ncbi:MAG: CDP-diacylglycerol--glycerol-3-phosphate 3-phosphatidyltransferase [Streptomycetales bacterium]